MSAFDLLCVSAAAPLMPQTASQWAGLYHQQIVEIYGSTETGIVAHRLQLKDRHWQAFSPVKLGVASGLLRVRSPFVSGQSEQHFQTADQVRLKSNHRFELLGRADAVTKIGGKRVSLRAVEDALVQCDGVRDAAVLAVSVQSVVREQAIWAVIEAQNTGACSAISLRKALRDKLDGVSTPKRFVWVDKLPRNSNGKTLRQSLEALFEPRAAIDV